LPTVQSDTPFLPTAEVALAPTATLAPSATRAPTVAHSATARATLTVSAPTETPVAASPTAAQPTPEPATPPSTGDPARDFEREVYALINGLRVENGVPPLAYSALLADAARAHSCEQAANGAISHTSSDGRTLGQRLPSVEPPWEWPSENIAAGFATPQEVVRIWFDEQPPDDWHRRNILSADQRELGVGFCSGTSGAPGYSNVVTADFARRTNLFPLVLNSGALAASSPTVRYWLYGAGWADAVRLGASPDLSALSWRPFAPEGSYQLSPAPGQQTVYAELRGPEGATQLVSATIDLEAPAQ
jgi:uncharacterized protein YkwD